MKLEWKPIQCEYGPHWHEQPNAEEEQEKCRKAWFESMGEITAMLRADDVIRQAKDRK